MENDQSFNEREGKKANNSTKTDSNCNGDYQPKNSQKQTISSSGTYIVK